jgi:uncharacterized protein YndB with AHSA1/START domain
MSIFHSTRELPVPPDAVFDAFRNPERLARWWGPNGFRSTFSTFEFRDGGSWLFTMHGPDGADYPNESMFLEVVSDALVRIRHLNLPHFDLAITLEPHAVGTLLTWHGVFEDRVFAENARQFLASANEQNLDRLAAELRGT